MKLRKIDETYLWDMREGSLEAIRLMQGVSLEAFLADSIRVRAVERLLEIVGEAASHVSRARQASCPEIPWAKIIGQRHVLAHDYGEVEPARLFDVVVVHLPPLVRSLDLLNLEASILRPNLPGDPKP
jgi:uncharacterized protein with HEPN domain